MAGLISDPWERVSAFESDSARQRFEDDRNPSRKTTHVKKGQEGNADASHRDHSCNPNVYSQNFWESHGRNQKHHEGDEEIVDSSSNERSQSFGQGDAAHPIQQVGIGKFSQLGGQNH